jgi:hypothetical protein
LNEAQESSQKNSTYHMSPVKGCSTSHYLQNAFQILVNGEPAKEIPPGQNMTNQKQTDLCNQG